MAASVPYDALFYVSFGGPEGMDDVMPYLDNVLRGKRVPHERKLEVAHHYELFGGVSPINEQNRAVIRALEAELRTRGPDLPIYFGNRNWHPLIPDTMQQMKQDGVRRALVFVSSAYSCYSGCRQYRENLRDAMEGVGEPSLAIDKIRVFYNHPGFIEANADHVREALEQVPQARRDAAVLLFTAHSIPMSMASGSRYEEQLLESCRLVAEAIGKPDWRMVYQSRSGPPHQPWLEPDVCDVLPEIKEAGAQDVLISPIGFVSDHLEVLFDLDTEAKEAAEELGLGFVRVPTVGTHPAYISMIRELIMERCAATPERRAIGRFGPSHDVCPVDCCSMEKVSGVSVQVSGKNHPET
jgi:ferrochelatase